MENSTRIFLSLYRVPSHSTLQAANAAGRGSFIKVSFGGKQWTTSSCVVGPLPDPPALAMPHLPVGGHRARGCVLFVRLLGAALPSVSEATPGAFLFEVCRRSCHSQALVCVSSEFRGCIHGRPVEFFVTAHDKK
jgi:hypothetical protein